MPNEFSEETRSLVAEAVHAAVCEVNGDDGLYHCAEYAVAGAIVLNLLADGHRYSPQCGGLAVLSEPPDKFFHICGEDNGFARGEYHAWVARAAGPAPGMPGRSLASEWVDFSARHYRRLAETLVNIDSVAHQDGSSVVMMLSQKPRRPWTAPGPPTYLWHEGPEPPAWCLFYVDEASSLALMHEATVTGKDHYMAVARAAVGRLRPVFGRDLGRSTRRAATP